jgi:hypothetical protein
VPLAASADGDVRFVVSRGVACILHGISRVTNDVDLSVAMDDRNMIRFVDVAQRFGLKPRAPEPLEAMLDADRGCDRVQTKQAHVFALNNSSGLLQVDCFLAYPIGFEERYDQADTMDVDGRVIRVSSKPHRLRAKQAVDSPRRTDVRDIEDL